MDPGFFGLSANALAIRSDLSRYPYQCAVLLLLLHSRGSGDILVISVVLVLLLHYSSWSDVFVVIVVLIMPIHVFWNWYLELM